jgi:hypothetical protein
MTGKSRRLGVVESAFLGPKHRLVLVRRDNVEHLLMIGGPTDVVVELNIVRAMPARDGAPQRPGELGRAPSIADGPSWGDGNSPDDLDGAEPAIEPAPARRGPPTFADEVRRPVPPGERRNFDPASLAPDAPPARPDAPPRAERSEPPSPPPRPARPPRPEARAPRLAETLARLPRSAEPAPTAPAAPSNAGVDEKELSDMAQRLEAALRRPSSAPAIVSPSAEPVSTGTAPAVEAPRPPRASSAAPVVTPPDAPSSGPTPKPGFENLEDEMASLLGRPKTP